MRVVGDQSKISKSQVTRIGAELVHCVEGLGVDRRVAGAAVVVVTICGWKMRAFVRRDLSLV